mgnify:FL=1
MIQIGSSKLKQVMEALDGQTHDGITFHVEGKPQGLSCKLTHNGESDNAAKSVVKKVVASLPGCATAYLKVDLLDEQGRII